MNLLFYDSPIGRLTLGGEGDKLKLILFAGSLLPENAVEKELPVLRRAQTQLEEYFAGKRKEFDLPLEMEGTAFRKTVWQALCTVPYGQTATYGDIAKKIGKPKACRAVGGANHHNPISIVVPWHRIIGADGSLTGFGGGLEVKKALLELEQVQG